MTELPPRARRIPAEVAADPRSLGTTSACAENTRSQLTPAASELPPRARRILQTPPVLQTPLELPPRARRIRRNVCCILLAIGTTSACAENTRTPATCLPDSRNYLRVRGEYEVAVEGELAVSELPPRARRIPRQHHWSQPMLGTTSACAENTTCMLVCASAVRNYLRVRGEYCVVCVYYGL